MVRQGRAYLARDGAEPVWEIDVLAELLSASPHRFTPWSSARRRPRHGWCLRLQARRRVARSWMDRSHFTSAAAQLQRAYSSRSQCCLGSLPDPRPHRLPGGRSYIEAGRSVPGSVPVVSACLGTLVERPLTSRAGLAGRGDLRPIVRGDRGLLDPDSSDDPGDREWRRERPLARRASWPLGLGRHRDDRRARRPCRTPGSKGLAEIVGAIEAGCTAPGEPACAFLPTALRRGTRSLHRALTARRDDRRRLRPETALDEVATERKDRGMPPHA